MKLMLCAFFGFVLAFQSFCQGPDDDEPIRIITYNIRFDNPGDGSNVWANRKERVATILRFHGADIFSLQEALIGQVQFFEEEFPDFGYYGVGRDDGALKGEFVPVFYSKSRFGLLGSGTFWMSSTPDIPGSTGWGATLPRISTWLKIKDNHSLKEFFVFNTHFDHSSQLARDESAKLLLWMIDSIAGKAPVVVTGDFNDKRGSVPYQTIVNDNSLVDLTDAQDISKFRHIGPSYTYISFDFIGEPGYFIDHIFVTSDIEITYHATLSDNWDGIYPSDHLPVLVEFQLK